MSQKEIHIISTGRQTPGQFARIAKEINEYVDFFHIREKQMSANEIYRFAAALIETGIPSSKIVINDRIDVASTIQAAGVQLAYHSLSVDVVKEYFPYLRIGKSIHSLNEARLAYQHGADYAIFGHIYSTQSKPCQPPRGIEELAAITQAIPLPIIAIGGIKPSNMEAVLQAGAAGIAVMSGVLERENPLAAIKQYVKLLH